MCPEAHPRGKPLARWSQADSEAERSTPLTPTSCQPGGFKHINSDLESLCSIINWAGRLPINKIKLSPVRLPTLPAQPASTTTVKPPKSAQWELHLALSSHQPCVPTHSEFAVIGAPLSTRACPGPWQHSRKPGRLDV
ncbi:hypothetical protein CapIbe_013779 [Capra ibex]